MVIPTFERHESLIATLGALARTDYPTSRWEAIVVDDGSSPAAIAAIREWIQLSGMHVRVVQQEHRGPAAARNTGARLASARRLIFIDNDIAVGPKFVRRHLEILDTHPGSWVVGRIVHPPELRRTPFGRYRDGCWEAFHRSHPEGLVSETSGMSAANLALPAEDLARLGGFDEAFSIASCEDWDLGLRARAAGIRILYDPRNIGVHNDWAVSLEQFCERQRLYSISDVLLWRKYGRRSPRADLIRENGPIRWLGDPPLLVLRKMVKRLLATHVGSTAVRRASRIVERVASDSWWNPRLYKLAVGIAIAHGVREGLARYGWVPMLSGPGIAEERSEPNSTRRDA